MGSSLGHQFDWAEEEQLSGLTALSQDELKQCRASYYELSHKSAHLTKKMFLDGLKRDISKDTVVLLDHLFNMFDTNDDGAIDLKEFCIGISVFTKSAMTQGDRLRAVFDLYDLDKSGTIERSELVAALFAMQRALHVYFLRKSDGSGNLHQSVSDQKISREEELRELREWVDSFFEQFDEDHNNSLDFREFKNAMAQIPALKTAARATVLQLMKDH